ncbi:polymorphic toxin type 23 domain-containing protein [Flavobacterium sp. ov086]|uniref:polymorphic toxin type 23 domain-containing protein n=1 Tax=Flavobacterium sp. ov086 TaxID=1761785 RepID=UPI000B756E73|nr:polymorphic toxin type 23 domain-containing protein [Flavobacterium sp. ov086]SNR79804.1 RHS repeat-associated core domain-containing protein [Flavobacterium sp. ov086]
MKNIYLTLVFLLFGFLGFGQSTEVGVTEGQLSVSLSGGANYTIPIAVPPGINGVVPQISLAYNSQGSNGIGGFGWNISGVSAISRIPATKFHDGLIDGVDFNSLDRFALDGQRLIVKNGTNGVYGADKTVYETESFSNIKITSFGVNPIGVKYGPAYFLVEYPDGSKAYYGNSTDSRSVTDWAITYWENPQGIRISYSYALANNMLDIASIKYGSLTTQTPINEIKFKYGIRKRVEQAYIGGLSVIRNTLLKEINVVGNGIGFRNYVLKQEETSLGYDRLITITEKNGDNSKSYNPTTFNYDTTVSDTPLKVNVPATLGISGINYINTDYISGDFNDDGKTDIILYSKVTGLKDNFRLFSNILSGKLNTGKLENVGAFEDIFPAVFLSSDSKMLPQGWAILKKTDTNCTISMYGLGSTSATFKHYEKQYNFSKTVTKASNWSYCDPKEYNGLVLENIPIEYLKGDFNGDGLTDVIAIEKSFYYDMRVCNFGNKTTEYQRPLYQGGKAYFFNLDRRITTNEPENIGSIINNDTAVKKYFVADFDGDGKSDIYVFETNFIKVYTLNKDNKLVLLYENTVADPGIALDRQILFGDFNGDGKTDFVIPNELNKDSWNFYLATGTSFNKTNTAIGLTYKLGDYAYFQDVDAQGGKRYPYCLNERSFIANDYNGDGKTDILYVQNLTTAQKYDYKAIGEPVYSLLSLYENKSVTNNTVSFQLLTSEIQVTGIKRNPIPVFTNHNQINHNLEFSLINDNAILTFNSPKDNREDVLLKGITNGNGVKETITYKPLQQDPYEPIYTPTELTETYPNIDIVVASGFKIVSFLEKQSKDVNKKQQFLYSGAVSNTEGLGFLGFRSTVRTNWYDDDSQEISTISKNDIALRGANTENYTVLGLGRPLRSGPGQTANTIVKEGSYTVSGTDNLIATESITLKPDTWIKPGSTFSAKINEDANVNSPNTPSSFIAKSLLNYESELLPNKVFKIKNTTTKQFNGLDDTSSETRVVYDQNNNPLKSTTYLKESGATIQTTVSDVAYNASTVSPYIIGRPKSKNQSVTVSGDVMTSEELYFYQNSLLTQIKKKGTNTDYITEDNGYDAFGNITKKTITASGLTPRVTSYEYDSSGRFLTKSTDIEKLSTSFVYNPDSTLKSETNPYGLTTSYLYDSWFKKTTTTDYLGKKNSYAYARSGQKTIVTSTADDGSVSEETFDDLGRKVKEGSKNIMGTFSYVDYLYDIQNRNYKVSEPYFGSAGTQWNETKYDIYGRVIKNIAATGKTTDITYSGLSTTVNDGTKSKKSVKNAIGNVMSMTDTPGGTIKYTYFANGSLKESDYAGVKTTIKQDGWGRKIELNDSSAGIYKYSYNGFGETTSTTTPNGTTTYTLDPLVGKVTQKTIKGINTDSQTTYKYDSLSKLLISSEFTDVANGSKKTLNTITYDDSKRISTTIEATPYATFTKEFKYDDFGRVFTETSIAQAGGKSSSKTIKNKYLNGSHWQITDNNTGAILWQTNTVNARGQLTNAQNGPTTVTNNYDNYGFASQLKYDKTSGSVNLLTLNTVFDVKKGNLTSRTNSLFNRNESFKYDTQDRLTEFTNAKGLQEKQIYDDQGRIIENDLGTYAYAKDKPYQNESITVTPEALNYYTAKPTQIITYNVFKSPVLIDEKGIDKISFTYNDGNDRSAMFYGGLQDEKLDRPLRKYYSADGSMEIKENQTTKAFEFITYIGGDGYSAPIVVKSNGTTQEYLYLQRDYQGSILAITNASGAVIEKRLFDAWGAIVSVKDGAGNVLAGLTILDRGYTGHEHLQSVGLINMNGRIYDPKLHRFLQPDNNIQDPSNTQNFNRYAYCYNNPLKYTDPSGEFVWAPILVGALIGAIIGGTSYVVQAAMTGNWNWGQFGVSIFGGAVIGGISGGLNPASLMGSSVGGAIGTGFVAAFLPAYGVKVGDWSFNISPAIAFGNVSGIGASISATYNSGDFSFSAGVGIMSNSNYNGFGKNGLEIRKSILAAYDDGKTGVSLGSNIWSGDFKQQTGSLGLHSGDFRAMYENDGSIGPGGDGGDKYRTAALNLSIGKFNFGFSLFTGNRDYDNEQGSIGSHRDPLQIDNYGRRMPNGFALERGTKYRMGTLTAGYEGYRIGVNSEHIRHAIQDQAIHNLRIPWFKGKSVFDKRQMGFENQSWDWKGYFQYKSSNIFTSW